MPDPSVPSAPEGCSENKIISNQIKSVSYCPSLLMKHKRLASVKFTMALSRIPLSDSNFKFSTPHIRRRVRLSHTSDSRVGPVDAQEPAAFYDGLKSPVRQLSSPQSPIKYVRGGFVRNRRCMAQESAYVIQRTSDSIAYCNFQTLIQSMLHPCLEARP